jgi:protein-S-isoprenylcysteine O-methyltransferase Ste14
MALQVGYWLWIAFIVSWNLAMIWTGKARSRGATGISLAYFAGYVVGFGLLFASGSRGTTVFGVARALPTVFLEPLWSGNFASAVILIAIEVVAFAFAWWARAHLGRLWSGMLTLREGHTVVDTGPYRMVRHPIYTGFIAASWALALLVATPTALVGALVLTVVMTIKAGNEEDLLRREVGRDSYDAYARRTPMIVPFLPH